MSFSVLNIFYCGHVTIIGVTKKIIFTVLLTKFPFVYLNGLHFVIYAWWKIM